MGLVALSLAALMKAFHLEFPWYGPFLMLAILGVFTSVNEAKAVAIVAHLLALLPPVVLGVYSMLGENLHIRDLIPGRSSKPAA